jgi:hypothetical protein
LATNWDSWRTFARVHFIAGLIAYLTPEKNLAINLSRDPPVHTNRGTVFPLCSLIGNKNCHFFEATPAPYPVAAAKIALESAA